MDSAKSNNSQVIMTCYDWYFSHRFKFQNFVYNSCHDLAMLWLKISGITIITVKRVDYRCIIHGISKSEAIYLLENFLPDDRGYI